MAVNWTERTLAFTNEPSPIRRNATGKQTGIDRGCVHTLALSNGTMLDMPQPSEREKREYLRLQRKLARQDTTNSRRGGKTAKFQWTHLRRNLDGRNVEMPLPDKLAGRKAEYEDAANRLRDLIKADPIAMDLSPYECERLKRFLRNPQKERLLEYDPDDPFYRDMFNRSLIDRDGLTELGRKAMEHYVASA